MPRGVKGSWSSEENRITSERHAKLRRKRRDAGLCEICGCPVPFSIFGDRPPPGSCDPCRRKRRETINRAVEELRSTRLAAGLCILCGLRPISTGGIRKPPNPKTCDPCRERMRRSHSARANEKRP